MTYLVTDNCVKCKHTDCVETCPVDCFHEGDTFLVIDPDECIDCGCCVPACPANAIFSETELTDTELAKWLGINQTHSKQWPVLAHKKPPLLNWEQWNNVPNKYETFNIGATTNE
jgi:ferredoxin